VIQITVPTITNLQLKTIIFIGCLCTRNVQIRVPKGSMDLNI